MRLPWRVIPLFCAAWLCALPFAAPAAAADPPSARRAALVNGALITGEAFDGELQRVERLSVRGNGIAAAANKKQVLENLIVRELLYQEAVKTGVTVPAVEVAGKMARIADGKINLESTLHGMGLNSGTLEAHLERSLVIEKFLEGNFSKDAEVSDQEVESYYREHRDEFREPLRLRLSHILVKVDPARDSARKDEGRSRIEALRTRLSEGADFAALAREDSDCYSAKSGGDLGYFLSGELSRRMEDEARALKPGEVSGVVEDKYGLHLLKLTELRPVTQLPLESVRKKIRQDLVRQKELKALAPFVKKLRASAKVELLLNEDELR
ncbi:MAG: hypothetical protein A2075_11600 [Geobacteraceae bacterium GWC2_58_44]|nr:MAG: hypothetical protein A2075_11600 [Geobacteraceae bacterium GWC2_58_44]